MTIDEAIEELEAIGQKAKRDCMPYGAKAIRLGIEALKRLQDYRAWHRLPGERIES